MRSPETTNDGLVRRVATFTLFALMLGIVTPAAAEAADCVWTGLGADANWGTGANWSACGAGGPVNGDTVAFPAGALQPNNSNNILNLQVAALQVTGLAAGNVQYVIGGQPLTIAGGSALQFTATGVLNMALMLAANATLTQTGATGQVSISNVNLGAFDLVLDLAAGQIARLNGTVSGTGDLIKTDLGTVTLAGANTLSGLIVVDDGVLIVSTAAGFGSAAEGTVVLPQARLICSTLVTAEPLRLNGNGPDGVGALQLSFGAIVEFTGATVIASPATIGLGTTNVLTLSGVVSGPGQTLTQRGTGMLILTNTNTHQRTTVEGGTLLVNGIQPTSAVTVQAGARLGGTGTAGFVIFSGTIAPGLSPGRLGTGILQAGAGAAIEIELNGLTPATQYDQIRTIDQPGFLPQPVLSVALGFVPPLNSTFVILDNTTPGPMVGTFQGLPEGGVLDLGGGNAFRITYAGGDGNDVVLTAITPVPLMATWMLLATMLIAGAVLVERLRRPRPYTRVW